MTSLTAAMNNVDIYIWHGSVAPTSSSQVGSCSIRQPNSQPLLLRGKDTSILIVITASALVNLITPVLCFFMPCAQCWSLPLCLVLPVMSSRLFPCLPDSDLAFVLLVFRGNFCQRFGTVHMRYLLSLSCVTGKACVHILLLFHKKWTFDGLKSSRSYTARAPPIIWLSLSQRLKQLS